MAQKTLYTGVILNVPQLFFPKMANPWFLSEAPLVHDRVIMKCCKQVFSFWNVCNEIRNVCTESGIMQELCVWLVMWRRNTNEDTTQVCNTPVCLTGGGFTGRCCSILVGFGLPQEPLPSSPDMPDMEHSSQTGDLAWRTASSMLIISRWERLKSPRGQEGEFGIRNVKTRGRDKKWMERIERKSRRLKACDWNIKAQMIKGQGNRNLFSDVRVAESELGLSFHPVTAVSMAIHESNTRRHPPQPPSSWVSEPLSPSLKSCYQVWKRQSDGSNGFGQQ